MTVSEKEYDDVINFILPRYKLNEFIYIDAVSRGCLVSRGSTLDRNIVATVLSDLADKKALEEIWLIRCPYCDRINTGIVYVHYEAVPHWFTCPYCDVKTKTGKNDFVDYAESVYKIRRGISLKKFRKEETE